MFALNYCVTVHSNSNIIVATYATYGSKLFLVRQRVKWYNVLVCNLVKIKEAFFCLIKININIQQIIQEY